MAVNKAIRPARRKPPAEPESNSAVEQIVERIRAARNVDFRNYKRPTLQRRIERRMEERKCPTAAEYLALLDRDPTEYGSLIRSMLVKVTSFFRDPEMWSELSRKVLPQMLAEKQTGEHVRVWCAGCATGEEAFTAAIVVAEAMGASFGDQDVKVFGTDMDEAAIAHARLGIYSDEQVRGVPAEVREKYFVQEPAGWAVRNDLRRCVVFGINNLVLDAPISRLDMLICRNVFIYLDAPLQKRVLSRFHYALRRHGILVLGKSELMPFAGRVFEQVDLQRRIYRKDGKRDAALSQERLVSLIEQESLAREDKENGRAEIGTLSQFHHGVIESLRIPVIATSSDGTVLVWNNAAAMLWGRSANDVSGKKIAALSCPGPGADLRTGRR